MTETEGIPFIMEVRGGISDTEARFIIEEEFRERISEAEVRKWTRVPISEKISLKRMSDNLSLKWKSENRLVKRK